MAAIQTLLNPLPESKKDTTAPPFPSVPRYLPSPSPVYRPALRVRTPSPPPGARKKQKISKDQAVFTPGAIRGECRYPPYEYQDELLEAHHQQFELHPIGRIAEYARHIPYNSEKKLFESKTGRQWFEVFQYNYRIPGDEKVYCMMWDYNIGLVRTTPLFRCMGYSKTTPAKMLNRNPGLREICHSITGGSLVAQGYWMPYEAAKAIAATFCWKMRYALTPVFGLDFPNTCLPPDDPHYGDMVLDHEITKRCTKEAETYRLLELESRNLSNRASSPLIPGPLTPSTPTHPRPYKELRPKLNTLKVNTDRPSSGYTTESSTGKGDRYDVDDDDLVHRQPGKERYHNNYWTPANTPRSVAPSDAHLPSPRDVITLLNPNPFSTKKRGASVMSDGNTTGAGGGSSNSGESELSSPAVSPKSQPKRRVVQVDEEYDAGGESESEYELRGGDGLKGLRGRDGKLIVRGRMPSDERAAYLLMGLRLQKGGALGNDIANGKGDEEMLGLGREWKRRATG